MTAVNTVALFFACVPSYCQLLAGNAPASKIAFIDCQDRNLVALEAALKQTISVDHVTIRSPYTTDKGIKAILAKCRPRELEIQCGHVTGKSLQRSPGCQDLRRLTVIGAKLDGDWLSAVSEMVHIEQIQISLARSLVTVWRLPFDVAAPHRLGQIRSFGNIEHPRNDMVSSDMVQKLRTCSKLTDVAFKGQNIDNDSMESLCAIEGLRGLDVSGTAIDSNGLAKLQSLNALERFDLSGTRVGDLGAAQIAKLMNLRELKLNGTSVTEHGLSLILAGTSLRKIGLSDVITDRAAGLLGQKTLEFIDLANSKITRDGLTSVLHRSGISVVQVGARITLSDIQELRRRFPKVTFLDHEGLEVP